MAPRILLPATFALVTLGAGCSGAPTPAPVPPDQRQAVAESLRSSRPSDADVAAMLARHPKNMAWVPAGPFVRGESEQARTDGYLIDMYEWPNEPGRSAVSDVDGREAARLCTSAGKRLCTVDEWERACKGTGSLVYSYGDEYDAATCGRGVESPHAAGALAGCASDYGVFDMSGSYAEWTRPTSGASRAQIRGGKRRDASAGSRCSWSTDESLALADSTTSFRCCRDEDAPKNMCETVCARSEDCAEQMNPGVRVTPDIRRMGIDNCVTNCTTDALPQADLDCWAATACSKVADVAGHLPKGCTP